MNPSSSPSAAISAGTSAHVVRDSSCISQTPRRCVGRASPAAVGRDRARMHDPAAADQRLGPIAVDGASNARRASTLARSPCHRSGLRMRSAPRRIRSRDSAYARASAGAPGIAQPCRRASAVMRNHSRRRIIDRSRPPPARRSRSSARTRRSSCFRQSLWTFTYVMSLGSSGSMQSTHVSTVPIGASVDGGTAAIAPLALPAESRDVSRRRCASRARRARSRPGRSLRRAGTSSSSRASCD
jgi:hypothetical protein